jgi:hypothetical protein
MTQRWYGDRLDPAYQPRPVEELQSLLVDAGLNGPFWSLR